MISASSSGSRAGRGGIGRGGRGSGGIGRIVGDAGRTGRVATTGGASGAAACGRDERIGSGAGAASSARISARISDRKSGAATGRALRRAISASCAVTTPVRSRTIPLRRPNSTVSSSICARSAASAASGCGCAAAVAAPVSTLSRRRDSRSTSPDSFSQRAFRTAMRVRARPATPAARTPSVRALQSGRNTASGPNTTSPRRPTVNSPAYRPRTGTIVSTPARVTHRSLGEIPRETPPGENRSPNLWRRAAGAARPCASCCGAQGVNSGWCDARARWNVAESSRPTRLRGVPGRVARLANAEGMKRRHKAWP